MEKGMKNNYDLKPEIKLSKVIVKNKTEERNENGNKTK